MIDSITRRSKGNIGFGFGCGEDASHYFGVHPMRYARISTDLVTNGIFCNSIFCKIIQIC